MKLIVFSRRSCQPCQMYIPILLQMIDEGYDIDIHMAENEATLAKAKEYNIKSVPTTLFMWEDTEVFRFSGYIPKAKLIESLEKVKEYHGSIINGPDSTGGTGE